MVSWVPFASFAVRVTSRAAYGDGRPNDRDRELRGLGASRVR